MEIVMVTALMTKKKRLHDSGAENGGWFGSGVSKHSTADIAV